MLRCGVEEDDVDEPDEDDEDYYDGDDEDEPPRCSSCGADLECDEHDWDCPYADDDEEDDE